MIKKFLIITPFVLIILLSFFAWRPLLNPGFFSMHDSQQVARLFELDKSLKAGQFPVRWAEDLGFGYGYPLFNFYPPLVYYLGEVFHLAGFGFVDSIKLVWFTALIGSGLAMYVLAKEFFGKTGGIVSALFYIYAPYHAVDAYVRGALAELFSFVWLPLVLFFSYKLVREIKTIWGFGLTLSLSLLMLTHNLIFLPFFPIFLMWVFFIWLVYGRRESFLTTAVIFNLSILLAFGLTAFFWLPSLWEKQYTLVDELLIKSLASYKIHFVCPEQLWNSLWGYGGSERGCLDGFSLKISKIHIIVSALVFIASVFAVLKSDILEFMETDKKEALTIIISFTLLLFSVFMTTEYSKIIWDNISFLWYLQFPWRFLEFAALFSAFLAGGIFLFIKNKKLQIAGFIVITIPLYFFNTKYFVPQTYLTNADDTLFTSGEELKWHVSSTSFEYLPKGIATKTTDLGTVWVDIDRIQIQNSKFKIQNGNLKITENKFFPDKFFLKTESMTPSGIQFQITNFPGWKVWIDNKETAINDDNKYKLITVDIPAGEHEIMGKFTNTKTRTIANLISLMTLFILFLIKKYLKITKWI